MTALALVLFGAAVAPASSIPTVGRGVQRAAAQIGQTANDFVTRYEPDGPILDDLAVLQSWRNRGYQEYTTTTSSLHALLAVRQLVDAGHAGRIQNVGVRIKAGFDRHIRWHVLFRPQ